MEYLNQISKEKKFINLPGQPFYRYDETFKKKVLTDISQGLISERKAAQLYSFNRNCIAKLKKVFFRESAGLPGPSKIIKSSAETMKVAEVLLLNQEVKLLRQQLAHEKLRSEALLPILEVAELDLLIPIQKKPLPQQSKK